MWLVSSSRQYATPLWLAPCAARWNPALHVFEGRLSLSLSQAPEPAALGDPTTAPLYIFIVLFKY